MAFSTKQFNEPASIEAIDYDLVPMGHIIGPHGILGYVKVAHYTEALDALLAYPIWWVGNNAVGRRRMNVKSYSVHASRLVVALENVTDRTHAFKLKGMEIAIPKSQLPVLPENGESGYYWIDLISAEVVNIQGDQLGYVVGLLETGANDVLRVKGSAAKDQKERLIPFIDHVVIQVDLRNKKILVDWGLDYG